MLKRRSFYKLFSSQATNDSPYSFLRPSIFSKPAPLIPNNGSENKNTAEQNCIDIKKSLDKKIFSEPSTKTLQNKTDSIIIDDAWKVFKTALTKNKNTGSDFPNKQLTDSIIIHLVSTKQTLNLKRAFAVVVFLLENDKHKSLGFESVKAVLESLNECNMASPAFALVNSMFRNRFYIPFSVWGDVLVSISRRNGCFTAFLSVFKENCRVFIDEKLEFMRPSLEASNAALEGCCRELESVSEAESVIEKMAVFGVCPNETSFGVLGYLYALKGYKNKIFELEGIMGKLSVVERGVFVRNLVSGYLKSGDLEAVSGTVLRDLGDNVGSSNSSLSEETFGEIVRGFIEKGTIKDLANLISEAQKLETDLVVEKSIGYGVVNACVSLGFLDKAHNVLDEMNTKGCVIGLGVYIPILKAYSKEQRTAEATQLVMEISNSGLELDVNTYDVLIEAAMSSQDFQSAFSLFRDMREARLVDLKGSYLTIMTGLTENHRPELMAAFLDEVVEDPRIEIGTHDWNSILHAFCKAGRLEDAKRTFRRMLFLQFEPNEQTYLSLINGYANAEKYFSVLMLWNEVKKRASIDEEKRFKLDTNLVDAFLYALVKGGYFDAVMQVVDKSQEAKIFVDKWRYKQAFMEKHKKLKIPKLRKRNFKKMEALVAFKNWAGLST